jgi:hypothetical protein
MDSSSDPRGGCRGVLSALALGALGWAALAGFVWVILTMMGG